MRTKLTLALAACAALCASSGALAQSSDTKSPSTKNEQKKSSLDRADRRHFRDIAQANMAEVQAGKVAQAKASSDEVKKLKDTLQRGLTDEQIAQYVTKIESEIGTKINQAAFAQVTGANN